MNIYALINKKYRFGFKCLWGVALLVIADVKADSVLEAGIGGFAISLPAYPGSKDQSSYLLPFPYFYYKDEKITVDREGLVGSLIQGQNWEIDVSFSGGIPVRSEDARIRKGMPDLDWTAEAGPRLLYYFSGQEESERYFRMHVFARKAFATDFSSINSIGYKAGLGWEYEQKIKWQDKEVVWTNRFTFNWADNNNLDYFYSVPQRYANEIRPQFNAHTGYAGMEVSSGITAKFRDIWLGTFVRYQNFSNTAQANSPLLQVDSNWSVGLGVVWILHRRNID